MLNSIVIGCWNGIVCNTHKTVYVYVHVVISYQRHCELRRHLEAVLCCILHAHLQCSLDWLCVSFVVCRRSTFSSTYRSVSLAICCDVVCLTCLSRGSYFEAFLLVWRLSSPVQSIAWKTRLWSRLLCVEFDDKRCAFACWRCWRLGFSGCALVVTLDQQAHQRLAAR